jgi:hypothetical protein
MMTPGIYWGIPKSATTTTSGQGNPQLAVVFSVVASAEAAAANGWSDLTAPVERTVYIPLTDKAWEYSKPKLEKLGFNGDFSAPAFTNTDGLELSCAENTYNGKTNERWELNGFGGATVKPAPADVTRRLSALWKQPA